MEPTYGERYETDESMQHRAEQMKDTLHARGEQMRSGMQQFDARLREVCREHPLAVLGGAIAAGFVIGRFVSRR